MVLLRSLWNPLVGEISWETYRNQPGGSVAFYLDVSSSMSAELNTVVALLRRFERHLRRPFWAFANTVEPTLIKDGQLHTRSTGGTSVACVLDNLRRTRPLKALIVTDGFVERWHSKDYSVPDVTVEVLATAKGTWMFSGLRRGRFIGCRGKVTRSTLGNSGPRCHLLPGSFPLCE